MHLATTLTHEPRRTFERELPLPPALSRFVPPRLATPTPWRASVRRGLAPLLMLATLIGWAPPAAAVDGCVVLLCLAAPSWRAIAPCVPPMRQLMRDLALGRPFPICRMSGSGNRAAHRWASAPDHCPPQYTHRISGDSGYDYYCDYSGAVSVQIDGQLWARTWWRPGGDSVTEFTPAAKARLGRWDTTFDDEYAAWLESQPPDAQPCVDC